MDFNKTESQNTTKQVVNHAYPPIIMAGKFAVDTIVIPAGTPLAKNAAKEYIVYDAAAAAPASNVVGVSTKDVDTAATGGAIGPVLRLGMVHADALTDNTPATLEALAAEKIFA